MLIAEAVALAAQKIPSGDGVSIWFYRISSRQPVTNPTSFQVNHADNKAHFRDFNNPVGIQR
jgi:hypothetical protein